jgi:hypothetical protein
MAFCLIDEAQGQLYILLLETLYPQHSFLWVYKGTRPSESVCCDSPTWKQEEDSKGGGGEWDGGREDKEARVARQPVMIIYNEEEVMPNNFISD